MSVLTDLRQLRGEVEEVLERHESERAAIDLAPYRGRPVAFAAEVLHFTAYDKQRELLEAPETHKYTVARGNHGAGKDAALACRILYDAYVTKRLCLALSASERQLLGQLWTEIRRRFVASDLPGVLLRDSLEIGGEKRIVGMTSGSVSNLTGWHDANGVAVFISEGQGEQVEAAAYDAALANVVDDRSFVVAVGNPIKPSGRFYEIHQRGLWHQVHFSAFDHPNIREGREVIPGGPTAAWVEEIAREYGDTSAYYLARVLGNFPIEGSIDQLVGRWAIDQAVALWLSGKAHVASNGYARRLVADIARGGPDLTCVAVVRGQLIEELTTFSEPDLMQTAKRLHDWAIELGGEATGHVHPTPGMIFGSRARILVDDAAIGAGVTDRLRQLEAADDALLPADPERPHQLMPSRVAAFLGAHKANRPDKFANRRAEAYFELRDALLRGRIALPPDEKLAEELLATSYTLTAKGLIIIEPKDQIRSKIGRSPDRADTCSMAAAPQRILRQSTYRI